MFVAFDRAVDPGEAVDSETFGWDALLACVRVVGDERAVYVVDVVVVYVGQG